MSTYDGPDYALVDLELSAATFAANAVEDAAIGTLSEMAEEDSTLSIVSPTDGTVKLDGDDLVVGENPSSAGIFDVVIRETNIYGTNNPHDTIFEITVTA